MERLRLLPLPVNLVAVGPTSELLKRPLSAIGNATVIELQRAPLNYFELSIKRTIDIVFAGTTLIALLPLLALVAIAIKLDSPGPDHIPSDASWIQRQAVPNLEIPHHDRSGGW